VWAIVGLAGCGFTLSFAALRDLAVASGLSPSLAFLWPLVVDGFIVVATAAAFRLRHAGRRVTWYPWTALALFAAVSVSGNAIHAASSDGRSVAVWIATVVSAVPAVALLVASHLLVVMAEHTARTARPSPTEILQVPDAAAQAITPAAREALPAHEDDVSVVTSETPGSSPALETGAVTGEDEDLAAWIRDQLKAGIPVTGRSVAAHLQVSDRTGRRRLDALKAARPSLFEVPA